MLYILGRAEKGMRIEKIFLNKEAFIAQVESNYLTPEKYQLSFVSLNGATMYSELMANSNDPKPTAKDLYKMLCDYIKPKKDWNHD